jgi:acyl CoA:acetate/3-ketoacid CoA transferase
VSGPHGVVVSPADAAALVRSGDTIATSGFVGIGTPDELLQAIADRYATTGEPAGLGLVFAAGQGDGKHQGLNRLAAPDCSAGSSAATGASSPRWPSARSPVSSRPGTSRRG